MELPVKSIPLQEAQEYFGSLTQLALLDLPASGALTRRWLEWDPTGPNLLTDVGSTDYSAV